MGEIQKLMRLYRSVDPAQRGAGRRKYLVAEVEDAMYEVASTLGVAYKHLGGEWATLWAAEEVERLEAEAEAKADAERAARARAPWRRFRLHGGRNGGRKPRRAY